MRPSPWMHFSGAWHLKGKWKLNALRGCFYARNYWLPDKYWHPWSLLIKAFDMFSLSSFSFSLSSSLVSRLPLNLWSMHKAQSLMSRKMYRSLTPVWLEIPGIPRRNDVSHRNKLFDSTKRIRALKNLKREKKSGKSCTYCCLDFNVWALLFLCEAHTVIKKIQET
jgi:hypothetical protein